MESLKKLWTQQLYKEFDNICYRYRVGIRPPLIRIMDFSSRWGHWDAETRTLALATRLIAENSWDAVIEILKHEMAHQIVSELWGKDDQHGADFKKACNCLGVEAWAQKAEVHTIPSLSLLKNRKISEEEEALMRRVNRLLALTRSSNEHEAIAAMNKVTELYEKYNVSKIQEEHTEELTTLIIDHKLKRLASYHAHLASILSGYFPVCVIFSSLYDKQKLCEFKVIEILGKPEHVQIAEYVYWYLLNNLKALWSNYQELTNTKGLTAKNSYYLGVLKGFEEKLRKSQDTNTQQTPPILDKSLIVKESERRLKEYVKHKHPSLHTTSLYRRNRHSGIYADGLTKGKQINIHEGLKHKPKGGDMKFLDRSVT